MSGIYVSQKHGVNPGMTTCYLCGESVSVILYGLLPRDEEAPRKVCHGEICDKCKGYMEQGIIVISVRDGEGDIMKAELEAARSRHNRSSDDEFFHLDNPYRTGGWVVLKQEAIERMLSDNPEILKSTLEHRMLFMEQAMWDLVGLPPTPHTPTQLPTTDDSN